MPPKGVILRQWLWSNSGGRKWWSSVRVRSLLTILRSGEIIWSHGELPNLSATTVTLGDDYCFASGGWPEPQLTCFRLSSDSNSDQPAITAEALWTLNRASEVPYVPSPLYHDGRLYLIHDQGVAFCLNAETGKSLWKRRIGGNFHSSPLLCGDRLLLTNAEGGVFVLDPKSGKTIAQGEFRAGCAATAAPSGSQLIVRTFDELICVEANPKTE